MRGGRVTEVMYGEAQRVIGRGLSPLTRILLGAVSALLGIVMILIALEKSEAFLEFAFGALCLAISLLCIFTGKLRNWLGRFVGLVVFIISAVYFLDQVLNGGSFFSPRSEQSVFNSILFFLTFGLPGIWFTLKGKFPMPGDKE